MRSLAWRLGLLAVALAAIAPRAAEAASFTAEIDRDAVAPGEPFIYRITLNIGDGDAENFRPPDFHGFQVQQAQGPSKSTSVQFAFGSNQQSVQSTYAWTYQLMLPPGTKGPLTIGAAHVRVGGRDLVTNSVRVRVGASSGQPQPGGCRALDPNRLFQRLFPGAHGLGAGRDREEPGQVASSPSPAFIRVIPDKTRAFVGEQVTVAWYLYVAEVPNRFGQTSEPHTDGFWSEEIPSTNPQGRLAFGEPQNVAGRSYNVALLFKKALFPLAPGKLTISPMEAEIAQGDFFGPDAGPPAQDRAAGHRGPGAPDAGPAAALRSGQCGALRDLRVGRSHGGLRGGRRHLQGRREGDGERAQRAASGAAAAGRLEELRAEDRRRPRRRRDDHRHQDGRVAAAPRARRKDHHPGAGAGDLRPGRQALSDRPQPADRDRRQRRGGSERGGGERRSAGGRRGGGEHRGGIDPADSCPRQPGRRGRRGVPAQRRLQGHRRHAAAGAGGAGAVRAGARAAGARLASDAAPAHANDGAPAAAHGRGAPGGRARGRLLRRDRSRAARGAVGAARDRARRAAVRRAGALCCARAACRTSRRRAWSPRSKPATRHGSPPPRRRPIRRRWPRCWRAPSR